MKNTPKVLAEHEVFTWVEDDEVKKTETGKFCVYLDKKRSARLFSKLTSAKSFLKKLDKELQSQGQDVATYEESED